ncbi:MAG: hypothetical protein JNG85_11685 [Spirochaetaceae bacterium]|nr:hypothetical protein [Spirochaetaceae bacterium]
MRYAQTLALAGILLLATFTPVAQEPAAAGAATGGSEAVFAPFPSRLRVAVREGKVVLSWEDSPEAFSRYAVYRSKEPMDGSDSFAKAERLGEAAAGAATYVDSPEGGIAYFYLVLAVGEDGEPYRVFIPGKNTTLSAVSVPAAAPIVVEAPKPAAVVPPAVTGIAASLREDAVLVSYRANEKAKRLVLYRGSAPILDTAGLLEAVLVASFEAAESGIIDYPVPGVDYWYALIPEDELRAGRILIEKGKNSTAAAVKIPAGLYRVGLPETTPLSRTPPLPAFLLERPLSGTGELPSLPPNPAPKELSVEAAKAASSLLALAPSSVERRPPLRVLAEESRAPSGGEDYALGLIVKEKLLKGDFAGGAEQLRKYLSLNRSAKAATRARFYLGEALAYQGAYRESFFEFLLARESYAAETTPWLEYLVGVLGES